MVTTKIRLRFDGRSTWNRSRTVTRRLGVQRRRVEVESVYRNDDDHAELIWLAALIKSGMPLGDFNKRSDIVLRPN